jgi:hypothetical protein
MKALLTFLEGLRRYAELSSTQPAKRKAFSAQFGITTTSG